VTNHLKRYVALFDGARGLLVASVVNSIAQSALLVLIPLVIRHVFDDDLRRGGATGVAVGGVIVLALDLVSSGLALWTRYMVLKATKLAIGRLRYALLAKIYALPQSFHDRHETAQIHGTIVQDTEQLDVVANAALGQVVPAAIVALGLMGVALALNPLLFALLVVALPGMVMVKRHLGVTVRQRTRSWRDAFNQFSAQTQLALRTRTLAEVRAAEGVELERGRARAEKLSAAGLQMAWRQGAMSIAQGAILASAAVLVLIVGGRAVANKQMTTGDLLSFYAVVVLLVGQVSTLATAIPTIISGHESLDRVDAFLDVDDPLPYQGSRRIAFRGGIELRRVTFGYGDAPLLSEFELSIAPEEHVVILGPNGVGKSTLASLILGLYRPWSGDLLADGTPYDELDMRDLRSAFGVVLQDPVILPGTVAENIAYGRPDASPKDIEQAAVMAGVAEFVDQLPDGYATRVGPEGALISGGQRQRVAIARALLGRPRLLILDEPTTHLDDAAIAALQVALADLPRRPTVITITHDSLLAEGADRVVHLRGGRKLPAER